MWNCPLQFRLCFSESLNLYDSTFSIVRTRSLASVASGSRTLGCSCLTAHLLLSHFSLSLPCALSLSHHSQHSHAHKSQLASRLQQLQHYRPPCSRQPHFVFTLLSLAPLFSRGTLTLSNSKHCLKSSILWGFFFPLMHCLQSLVFPYCPLFQVSLKKKIGGLAHLACHPALDELGWKLNGPFWKWVGRPGFFLLPVVGQPIRSELAHVNSYVQKHSNCFKQL